MKGDNWMNIRAEFKKGLNYTEIGKKYGIDPRTVKKYSHSEKKPEYPKGTKRESKIEKYKGMIDELLCEAPYIALRILEIITEQGFDGKYTIVKDYVKRKKDDLNKQATVRFETIPGLQGQVDWAHFPDYRVFEDGKYKKLYSFLMILGYSRNRYIEFVTDMSTDTLLRCHINAFRYFKGYPDEILYDNMKQVVVKRLLRQKDSTLNPQFEDFAGFYGFKPVLCRPYRGQTKGKIERTVSFVRNNLMIGIKYDNLTDLNIQALAWCNKVNSNPLLLPDEGIEEMGRGQLRVARAEGRLASRRECFLHLHRESVECRHESPRSLSVHRSGYAPGVPCRRAMARISIPLPLLQLSERPSAAARWSGHAPRQGIRHTVSRSRREPPFRHTPA